MKKVILMITMLCIFAAVSPVFAQKISEENQSEYYYVNIPIEKIYLYRAGYVVNYRQGINKIGTLYLPNEWFTTSAGKGELVTLPSGNEWPSLSIYYKEGKLDHVRLYVHRWKGHQTWGVIPMTVNIDDRFKNADDIEIQY